VFSCLSPPMPAAMKASMLLLLPAVVNAWSIDRVKDAALEPTKNDLDSDMPLRRNPEHEAEVAFSFVSNDTVSAQGTTCSYGLQFPNAHACNAGCDWGHNQGCDQSCDGDCDNWCDHGCDGWRGTFCDDSCNQGCDHNCDHSCNENPTTSCDDSCKKGCDSCLITPGDFFEEMKGDFVGSFKALSKAMSTATLNDLRSLATAVAQPACTAIWAKLCWIDPVTCAFQNLLGTLQDKCTLFGGDESKFSNSALSIGFVASGHDGGVISGGLPAIQGGLEIGLAVDMAGGRYCYVGGCAGAAATVPPLPDGGFGIAPTLWKDIGDIPGTIPYASLGGDIKTPLGFNIAAGLNLFGQVEFWDPRSFSFDKFRGIGAEIGLEQPIKIGSFGISSGVCWTPLCLDANSPHSCGGAALKAENVNRTHGLTANQGPIRLITSGSGWK
jgi:hypothetical protein